ncbi:MAG: BatD family protein, partial [Kiritimatiellales bacterium]
MKFETGNLKTAVIITLVAMNAFGFEATMTIQPPLIQLGESAVLSIEVRGAKNPPAPVLPDVPGLQVVSAGQSTQMNWINGKSDNFVAFNYTVYPQKTGSFSIGPFDYQVNGESRILSGELKVVGSSGDASQPQSWADLLFARLEIDRTNAYVQEPFGLTLSVYSRQGVQMAGNINLTGMPETGLDGLQWQETQGGRDVINNAIYDIRRFQTRTRAVSSGTFTFS